MKKSEIDVRLGKLPPMMEERLRNLRINPLPDKKAQALQMKWAREAFFLPPALKDRVGRLYMSHILNVNEKTILRFENHEPDATHTVGLSQSGIVNPDATGFWNGVKELQPKPLSDREIGYLRENDTSGYGATMMLNTWHLLYPNAPLLERLAVNAHAYK